jgi:hypothetical protein
MTTYIVGFADEVLGSAIEAMAADARHGFPGSRRFRSRLDGWDMPPMRSCCPWSRPVR